MISHKLADVIIFYFLCVLIFFAPTLHFKCSHTNRYLSNISLFVLQLPNSMTHNLCHLKLNSYLCQSYHLSLTRSHHPPTKCHESFNHSYIELAFIRKVRLTIDTEIKQNSKSSAVDRSRTENGAQHSTAVETPKQKKKLTKANRNNNWKKLS